MVEMQEEFGNLLTNKVSLMLVVKNMKEKIQIRLLALIFKSARLAHGHLQK